MSFEDRSLRTGPTLGNGSKKNFPYDFLLYSAEEIEVVKLNNTTLAETLYSYDDGDFTVDGIGEDNGGEITLAAGVAAPTSGESILCRPKTKLRQQLVLTEGGKVPMVSLMKALDMMGFRICELWEVVSRTLVGGASTIFTGINGAIDGRALKFKDNGNGTWSIEPSVSDPDAAGDAVIAAEAARDAALGYASDAGDDATASEASRIAAEAAQAAAEAAAAQFTLASQAEAEAGTDNTKYMSALRVAQAIDAQVVAPVGLFYPLGTEVKITTGLTLDGNWRDLSLAAYIPDGSIAVSLVIRATAASEGLALAFRKNGGTYEEVLVNTRGSGTAYPCAGILRCDANRVVEYNASSGITYYIVINGYFK